MILRKHHEAQQHVGGARTVAGQSQLFNKVFKSIQQAVSAIETFIDNHLLNQAQAEVHAMKYGFEMAFVIAGSAINQDHTLVEVYTTPAARNVSLVS
jgi:hypothetical protein